MYKTSTERTDVPEELSLKINQMKQKLTNQTKMRQKNSSMLTNRKMRSSQKAQYFALYSSDKGTSVQTKPKRKPKIK